jgi:hypothetical protein
MLSSRRRVGRCPKNHDPRKVSARPGKTGKKGADWNDEPKHPCVERESKLGLDPPENDRGEETRDEAAQAHNEVLTALLRAGTKARFGHDDLHQATPSWSPRADPTAKLVTNGFDSRCLTDRTSAAGDSRLCESTTRPQRVRPLAHNLNFP